MKIVELKTDPTPFWAVWTGHKTAELRYDDRGYYAGIILNLRETHFSAQTRDLKDLEVNYTGRELLVEVLHVLRGEYGLSDGWCMLSFKLLATTSPSDRPTHANFPV